VKRILIVTGGSRGIGAATARLAAQRGYAVCVNYVQDRIAAQSITDEIKEEGGRAIAVACDISSESEVVRLFESVDKAFGRVTGLASYTTGAFIDVAGGR
jgi:NAD(P)-dependent dehydrogenase (short-subunit alcohol dehydrogenase family)